MAIFKYKGIDATGKITQGRIDAANTASLETRLEKMGLELITCKEVSAGGGYISGRKVTRRDLITFCIHMEQITRVGIPIIEGLTDLRDSLDNPRFREVISAIIVSIDGGKTFSEALEEFPRIFDEIFVNLIRVGEHSGQLSQVLKRMTESLKWQDELAAQTKKIILYPAFVGFMVMAVIFFLMLYLVPQMVSFIQNMGEELPLHTKILILVSDTFSHYWYLFLAGPVIAITLLKYLAHTKPAVRYTVDKLKLKLWLVGPVLNKIILARFSSYFALLYASGVSVLSSIRISEDIAGNTVVAAALREAGKQIADGKNVSESFEVAGLFPPLVLRMLKVGESTGALDEALMNVSYFYNRDVKESIEKLQSMIEPIMTVILGVVLGWVMLSVLGPVYDIISRIQA